MINDNVAKKTQFNVTATLPLVQLLLVQNDTDLVHGAMNVWCTIHMHPRTLTVNRTA